MSSNFAGKAGNKERWFRPQPCERAGRAGKKKYNPSVSTGDILSSRKGLAVSQSANDEQARIAKMAVRVRIAESFSGVVAHVGEDEVVVVFDVNNDLVEHVYHRRQFIDKLLPKEGQCLTVSVRVTDAGASKNTFDQQKGNADVARANTREYSSGNAEF